MDDEQLWRKIRKLSAENQILKDLLNRNNIPYDGFIAENSYDESESYESDQGARIVHPPAIGEKRAAYFYSRFWGREDVYARRFVSKKTGKSGYAPQCHDRWNNQICPLQQGKHISCQNCSNQNFIRLDVKAVVSHLQGKRADGTDVIGVYPMYSDDTCRFLVFDFDNHAKNASSEDFANSDDEWREEVDGMRAICKTNDIPHLVERSRSGRGAHLWIFFSERVPASLARRFGFALLDRGAQEINLKSFRYYDRMFPAQDHLKSDGIGNLIALPLQGQALKDGNSAFIDEDWNAYPDQWNALKNTPSVSKKELECKIDEWNVYSQTEYSAFLDENGDRIKPWKREEGFLKKDVSGYLHITLANKLYVDAINIRPVMQNQLRRLATVSNPEYYKNRSLGIENFDTPSLYYLGSDENGYIALPRGLQDEIEEKCIKAEIEYRIKDERESGHPINIAFVGVLKDEQKPALETLSNHDTGILHAATAFGKTVVSCALIAEKKTSTLILLESSSLIDQWIDSLNRFLDIDEEPPVYKTKTGRTRQRASVIGQIHGAHDSSTGIIDIAMVGSLCKKGVFHERLKKYGLVILDECHHAASNTIVQVLSEVRAKYVYGVTATPKRGDRLEKINNMLLGPIRYRYTSKERAMAQGIDHLVIPRFTRTVLPNVSGERVHINKVYELIRNDEMRDNLIISDVVNALNDGRTPIVLSKYKDMAERLYEKLKGQADHIFIMTGNNKKEHAASREMMKNIPDEESLLLIATGQLIGEGFDLPRLDTLFMTTPVRGSQIVEQYAGRLNRDYDGKKDVLIYDYVDGHILQFDNMYHQRLRAYRQIGYELYTKEKENPKKQNAIYGYDNYFDGFKRDLLSADKSIIIASPTLSGSGVKRIIEVLNDVQTTGVSVTIITKHPDSYGFGKPDFWAELQNEMRIAGFEIKHTEGYLERYSIIDKEIVWYGSMNLLGKPDADDSIMRVIDGEIAEELLLMTFGRGL